VSRQYVDILPNSISIELERIIPLAKEGVEEYSQPAYTDIDGWEKRELVFANVFEEDQNFKDSMINLAIELAVAEIKLDRIKNPS